MPRFEASALRGYCVSVLTASGVERSCAEAVADALIDAELTGVSTHGVSRLAVYMPVSYTHLTLPTIPDV